MLKAKPVIKGKLWIVKHGKEKVATIQAVHGSKHVVLVSGGERWKYPSVNMLKKNHNIIFDANIEKAKPAAFNVCGFPTDAEPFNGMYDVIQGYPTYVKHKGSKSFYCAGYYLIQYRTHWIPEFCPKLLTLSRYTNKGPFKTFNDATLKALVI